MPIKPGRATDYWDGNEHYHFLKIGDIQIAYREIGEGSPILMVHGFGVSSYTWEYVVKELPPNYRYIMLDLKGFGNSDKPQDHAYRIADQVAILKQVIQTLGLSDVTLVGHSYGGAVVLTYLTTEGEKHAEHIRGLILIDSAGYDQVLPPLINRLNIPIASKVGLLLLPREYLVRMTLKDVFFDDTRIPADLVAAYAQPLRSPGGKHALLATARYLAMKDGLALNKQIPTLPFPTLIIWGEQDQVVPVQNAYKFDEDLPNSTLAPFIPNCGHAPQEECPTETAALMSDFLERLYR